MKVQFSIEELEKSIYPDNLLDTLKSLMDNKLIEGYLVDYRNGTILIEVPKDVEVREIMAGFEENSESGRKPKRGGH